MNMVEIIEKKKLGKALTREEIDWFVQGRGGRQHPGLSAGRPADGHPPQRHEP